MSASYFDNRYLNKEESDFVDLVAADIEHYLDNVNNDAAWYVVALCLSKFAQLNIFVIIFSTSITISALLHSFYHFREQNVRCHPSQSEQLVYLENGLS